MHKSQFASTQDAAEKASWLTKAAIVTHRNSSGELELVLAEGSLARPVRIERLDLRELVSFLKYNVAVRVPQKAGGNYLVFAHRDPRGCIHLAGGELPLETPGTSVDAALSTPGSSFLIEGARSVVSPAILLP